MIKNLSFAFLAFLVLASCTPKNAKEAKTGEAKEAAGSTGSEYILNSDESTIHWRGTKPGGEHYGHISLKGGTLFLTEGNISGGKFVVDMNSVICEDLQGDMNKKLVGHLMSEDFFHTSQYPEAIFEIVTIDEIPDTTGAALSDANHEVTGNLKIRGNTKSIAFPLRISYEGESIRAVSNEFSIDRTLWGVNFKSKSVFAEFKDDFISDMINLRLEILLTAKK